MSADTDLSEIDDIDEPVSSVSTMLAREPG